MSIPSRTRRIPLSGGGGGSTAWGDITGTLDDQTDLGAALSGRQGVWYINSASGNDSNSGRSPDLPKATIAAVAAELADGETVCLARGSVWRETADFDAFDGCRIEAYGGGERPMISAKDVVGSFTLYSGAAYTFTVTLDDIVAARGYPGVFEDRVRLVEVIVGDTGIADEAAAIAHVEATPGTFYFAGPGSHSAGWAAGEKTYYIHASDSSDPGANGKTYEVYKREFAALTGGNYWESVVFDAGWNHSGLFGNGQATFNNCVQALFGRHGALVETAAYDGLDVVGSNPRYAGALYHANPASGSLAPPTVVRNAVMVGSESLDDRSMGFFTHGSTGAGDAKQGWIIENVDVSYVSVIANFDETNYAHFRNLRARQFFRITTGIPAETTFNDCDIRGGHPESTTTERPVEVGAGNIVSFLRCHLDVVRRNFLSQTATQNAGSLIIHDSTVICRDGAAAGDISVFFRTETASATMDKLEVKRSTLYMASDSAGHFAKYGGVTTLDIDDVYLLGLIDNATRQPMRDPTLVVNSVETPLSSILPNARVIWGDPARAIATDDESGFALKTGAYRPGMRIRGGVAFSAPGGTAPLRHVLVGDRIEILPYVGAGAIVQIEEPAAFLNSVAFCNATARTFVAAGNAGTIYYSDLNGQNWLQAVSGVSDDLHAVAAHTGGTVIAVGDDGTINRSLNSGIAWTEIVSNTTAHLYAVATDGTTWVAAGSGGAVGTSNNDGLTWSWSTVGTADHHALMWHTGLSLFFLGSDGGAIRTSPASPSWTLRTSNELNRISGFAQVPDGVVASLYQTTARFVSSFLHSADGITWEPSGTVLPFDVTGVAGSGTSSYTEYSLVAVGESEAVAMAYRRASPWSVRFVSKLSPAFAALGVTEALKTIS